MGVHNLLGSLIQNRGLFTDLPVASPGSGAQFTAFTGSTAGTTGGDILYSSAPLGSAVSGRIIYVIHGFFDGASTSGPDTCSVTVGGNAATLLGSVYKPSDNTCGIGVWAYQDDGALGTSADIEVTDGTTRNSRSIGVVTGQGNSVTVLDSVSDADISSSVVSSSLDTTGAEALLYVAHLQNGVDGTADAPFTDGGGSFDENSDEWVVIGWDNSPSGSSETVDLYTGHASLRGAYLALSLASS